MTRPDEAAGLTAALAKSINQRAADLARLLSDPVYRAALETPSYAGDLNHRTHKALEYLFEAQRELSEIAAALTMIPGPARQVQP